MGQLNHWFAHGILHGISAATSPVIRPLEHAANATWPNHPPEASSIMELALRGWITEKQAQEFLLDQGILLNSTGDVDLSKYFAAAPKYAGLWNRAYWAMQELPTVDESFTLANRGLLTDKDLDVALRRRGFYSPTVRRALENLRYEIPGSSDLVRFSVRHVFEPDLIERLGYNAEFRPILDMWHRFQGLNYKIFTGPFAEQVNNFEREVGLPAGAFIESYAAHGLADPTWAQAFWWSHWVLPSPTQGYEMYFRLRPDRDHRFDPAGTSDLNFGLEDLELLLRANDYPPSYRRALAAIAHRIPGIRFLRQLRATDIFQYHDVVELLLRQGYSPGDAAVLAQSVERNDRDQRRRAVEQQAKGQLARYWETGVIDQGEYVNLLIQHGLTPGDAADTAKLAEIDLGAKRVEKIVAFIKKRYTKGAVDKDQAEKMLLQAGITAQRTAQYLDDWSLEVQAVHREISAQQAVRLSCAGLIDLAELTVRLTNLGYAARDAALLTREAELCQQARATKAAAQGAKAEKALQSELKRRQREAAQGIQAARRQLAAHGSPSQLRKWYCEGHIGTSELYSRLAFLGWPPADIDRLIGDCKGGQSQRSGTGQPGPTNP